MMLLAALFVGHVWASADGPPMQFRLGALLPLGEVEGDTSSMDSMKMQAREWRDAFKVAVEMVNNDDAFNVEILYDDNVNTGTILDSGLDAGTNVANGDVPKTSGSAATRDQAYLNENSTTQLCKAAIQLCNSDVAAVIGGYRSSRSIGMARCCFSQQGVPQVSPGSTSAYLDDPSEFPNFFRTVPNDSHQSQGIVALLEEYGYDKVSMIYTSDAYAGGMARAFKKLWLDKGYAFSPPVNRDDDTMDLVFPIETAETNGEAVVDRLLAEGHTGIIIIFAISSDTDWLMRHLEQRGMTGAGWTYFGGDGSVSIALDGLNANLESAFQGFVGTNVKAGEGTSAMYTAMVTKWREMSEGRINGVQPTLPWATKGNTMANSFSAQVVDAVYIVAKAADTWYKAESCAFDSENPTACTIGRDDMLAQLRSGIEVEGIGNTSECVTAEYAGKRCFRFKGREGPSSYEIVNAVGSTWLDVGDFERDQGQSKLTISRDIEWPGGTTKQPDGVRPKIAVGDSLPAFSPEKNLRLPITLGGLFPLGEIENAQSDLGSTADQAVEYREAFKVAAELVNSDDSGFDVQIMYDENVNTGTLRDTGFDGAFKGDDSKVGVSEGDNNAKLGQTRYLRNTKYATDNADTTLCTSAKALCDNDDVVAVVGALRSSRSIGAARCCLSESGLAQISYGSTSSYLSDQTEFPAFFRAVPNDDNQARAIVALLKQYGYNKVGMVYSNDAYAGGMARKFKELWLAEGKQFSPPVASASDHSQDLFLGIHEFQGESGRKMAERLRDEGDSPINLVFLISGDTDAFMKHCQDIGMTGKGFAYMGGDGSTGTDLTGRTAIFKDAYEGFLGSTVKMPPMNAEYIRFISKWEKLWETADVYLIPWQGKSDRVMTAFSAQVHDAVMIAATAAHNWYNNQECSYNPNPAYSDNCKIERADMVAELKKSGFEVGNALGNTVDCVKADKGATEKCFRFAGEDNNDGPASYEIVNAVSDLWLDVGDFDPSSGLTMSHTPMWAGGTTEAPDGTKRPPLNLGNDAVATSTTAAADDDDDSLPGWVTIGFTALIIAVCVIALVLCWLIKREKEGKAFFVSNQM